MFFNHIHQRVHTQGVTLVKNKKNVLREQKHKTYRQGARQT